VVKCLFNAAGTKNFYVKMRKINFKINNKMQNKKRESETVRFSFFFALFGTVKLALGNTGEMSKMGNTNT